MYGANYVYPEWLNNEDIVFQQECDKIHSYLMHFEEHEYISRETINHGQHENIQNIKEYSGKITDEKWWHYNIERDVKDEMDTDQDIMNDECIYHQLIENMGIFRWQSPHGFTSKQYEGLMHLKQEWFINIINFAMTRNISIECRIISLICNNMKCRILYDANQKMLRDIEMELGGSSYLVHCFCLCFNLFMFLFF